MQRRTHDNERQHGAGRLINRSAKLQAYRQAIAPQEHAGPSTIYDWTTALTAPTAQLQAFDGAISDLHDQISLGNHQIWGDPLPHHLAQLQLDTDNDPDPNEVRELAARGVRGSGAELPYREAIQAAFGAHDISDVVAHTDSHAQEATEAMQAHGFALGGHIAFHGSPDLFTAAHEAAHVVQQRAGVVLSGGVGRRGDVYEQHADAVASLVVAGRSAEALLSAGPAGGRANTNTIQFKKKTEPLAVSPGDWVELVEKTEIRTAPVEPPNMSEERLESRLDDAPAEATEKPKGKDKERVKPTKPAKRSYLSKGTKVRVVSVTESLLEVELPRTKDTPGHIVWIARGKLKPIISSEEASANAIEKGATPLLDQWVIIGNPASGYAETTADGASGGDAADELAALVRTFVRVKGANIPKGTKARVMDEVIAGARIEKDKKTAMMVQLDLPKGAVWVKREYAAPLPNAHDIAFEGKRIKVVAPPEENPEDLGKEGLVKRHDLGEDKVLVTFDGESEPRWVACAYIIAYRGEAAIATGQVFVERFNDVFGVIVGQLDGPLDEVTLCEKLSEDQRQLLAGYFHTRLIPSFLFTGPSGPGGFTGAQRKLMAAIIIEGGKYQVVGADGIPQRPRKVVGNNCGEWVRLVEAYAGVTPRDTGRHGIIGVFDPLGNIVLGAGQSRDDAGFKGKRVDGGLEGEEAAHEGLAVMFMGQTFQIIDPSEGGGAVSQRQLDGAAEKSAKPKKDKKDPTPYRLGQLPFSRFDEIEPGDWLWYYNGNPSQIGAHSVIFESWTGPRSKPGDETNWREAQVHSQPRPEEPGGRRHKAWLGDRFAKLDEYRSVTPINKVSGSTDDSSPADTVDQVLAYDKSKARASNQAFLKKAIVKVPEQKERARVDAVKVSTWLGAENERTLAMVAHRLAPQHRDLIADASASTALEDRVAAYQLLVALDKNVALFEAGKKAGGPSIMTTGVLEQLALDWSLFPRPALTATEQIEEALEFDETGADAKNTSRLKEKRLGATRVLQHVTELNGAKLAALGPTVDAPSATLLRDRHMSATTLSRQLAIHQVLTWIGAPGQAPKVTGKLSDVKLELDAFRLPKKSR